MQQLELFEKPQSSVPFIQDYHDFIEKVWVGSGKYAGEIGTVADLRNLYIATAGLGGETGEILEKLKKYVRDEHLDTKSLLLELGDVLYYLVWIGRRFGYSLEDIINANKQKLEGRSQRGTMRGSGDNR